MKTLVAVALVALFTGTSAVASADPAAAVRAAERAWLDAYEQGDLAAMDRIVADGFVITYQDGNTQTKADILAMLRQAVAAGYKGSAIVTEGTTAHRFGEDTVVLRGIVVTEMLVKGEARTMRSQYTDTWVRLDGQWRVAASHLSTAPAVKP